MELYTEKVSDFSSLTYSRIRNYRLNTSHTESGDILNNNLHPLVVIQVYSNLMKVI